MDLKEVLAADTNGRHSWKPYALVGVNRFKPRFRTLVSLGPVFF